MKKLLSILLALLLIFSMTVSALATEEESGETAGTEVTETEGGEAEGEAVAPGTHPDVKVPKEYDITGGDGETTPAEVLSFTVAADDANPDSAVISVADLDTAESKEIVISFPTYTTLGVYKYTVTENEGETLAVGYDENGIEVIVTVVNENAGNGSEDVLKVYVAVFKILETGEQGPKIAGDDETQIEEPGAAAFTNEYGMGSLTVTKEVTGNLASNSKEFLIHIVFEGGENAGNPILFNYEGQEAQPLEWENGMARADVLLKHGMSVIFNNIPAGVTYTVQEDGDHLAGEVNSSEGYTVTYEAEAVNELAAEATKADEAGEAEEAKAVEIASGAIEAGDEDTVKVINEKKTDIVTGIILDSLPYVLIGVAVIAAVVIMIIRKKRNSEEE